MTFLDIVKGSKEVLCCPFASFPGTSLTKSTVKENLNNGILQAETIIALQKVCDFDIVFPMMDLTVEAEAFGANINWDIDELPAITGKIIADANDVKFLPIPEIGEGNRLGIFVEACRKLKMEFPNKWVWGYILGPFSVAGRLMGMTEISIAIKLEPELVHHVLEKVHGLLEQYASALLITGIDGLVILEPASGMLDENDANEFSNNYIKRIVNVIKDKGKIPVLHNCGRVLHLVESLCATEVEVLHVGSVTEPYDIYPRVPENVVLMGNLNPTETFLQGAPEKVRENTIALLKKMLGYERFVISSGCDIPPGTPIENLIAFKDAVISLKQIANSECNKET
ncbi:MAG TPA: uroporphyrinogen decarboxylase family protein [Candidatus Hydrogenedens sp.]|nr:uroporphyrinogen decarboxylase family protein [Candidatus Hydrogenedens sp.]HOL19636.1 uroporphyrinogen decarboxylase family protein [Candidatus Hydrogenedens sp.]HPP59324.1 uroporphyrinogen decarboxylase family protein [Candidatus Hydrogenedens sp.]